MVKILVIDDQQDNLITLKAVIKTMRPTFEVLTAQSGLDGIEIAKINQPDCIFLDIIMPKYDGYEICQIIKADEQIKHIPIIMLTAIKTDSQSRVRGLEMGADAFLSKPIDPPELIAQLDVMLRIKAAEDKLTNEKLLIEQLVKERTQELEASNRQLQIEISERKHTERELIEKEIQTRSMISTAMDGFWELDENGSFLYANKQSQKLLGYNLEELSKLTVFDIDSQHTHQEIESLILDTKKIGNIRFETKVKCKNSRIVDVEANIRWIPSLKHAYVFLHDISNRKKEEDLLKTLFDMYAKSVELSNNQLYNYILDHAINITDSTIGFFHKISEDQQTIILTAWSNNIDKECSTIEETHYPVNKAGNWLDCLKTGKPIIYNDFPNSPNQKGTPDGHIKVNRYLSIPVFEKGKIRYIYGIGNKIDPYTEKDKFRVELITQELTKILKHRNTEQIIRENEERFRALYENTPFPYQSLNSMGNFVDVNPAWETVTGYTKESVMGKNWGDILHDDWKKPFVERFKNFKKNGSVSNLDFKLRKKNNEYIDIQLEGKASYDADGNFRRTFCVFQDVTARKKVEIELRKLQRAVEQSPISIVITDLDGNIEYANRKLFDLTGYTMDEILGKNPNIFQSGEMSPNEYKELWDTISSGKSWVGEFHNKKKNGELFWENALISPIYNSKGETINYLAVKEDISERKRIEDELILALKKAQESDRLKSSFLAMMSHELRTPLNAIIGFSDLISDEMSLEDILVYVKIINKSGNHLLSIITDLLDISLIEANEIKIENEPIDLVSLLQETNNIIASEKRIMSKTHIDINIILPPGITKLEVNTDYYKIQQILINLLKNALKFTDQGLIEYGFIIQSDLNLIKFWVKDTGIGIDKDKQDFIFDAFRQADDSNTRKHDGVGLGLTISKRLTKLLGGEMKFTSSREAGSIFEFTIPMK